MADYEQIYELNATDPESTELNTLVNEPELVLTPITNADVCILTGTVYGGTISNPINGAIITIYDPSGEAVATTTSATVGVNTGYFSVTFSGTYGVIYSVVAKANGYEAYTNNIAFSASQTSKIVILLPVEDQQIVIYGYVYDEENKPISDVTLTITDGSDFQLLAYTGVDGAYFAYGNYVRGTTYTITANKFAYDATETTVTIPTTTTDYFINANLTLTQLPVTEYTAITGQVVEQKGSTTTGVANAFVGLYQHVVSDTYPDTLLQTTVADSDGYYTFVNVESGFEYVVRATKFEQVTSS